MSWSSNSSRLPYNWCCLMFPNVIDYSSTYYQVTLAACVVTALLAPMAVAGNALILAAIWRNPSLRTPSYVLLAGLAVSDFCTGLLCQPFFVAYKLSDITGNRRLYCIAGLLTESTTLYFSPLTVVTIMMIGVERWLHMSQISLLTVRRIVIIFNAYAILLIVIVTGRMLTWYFSIKTFNVIEAFNYSAATLCVVITAFAYFKVLQVIRHHRNQVQTIQNDIDMEKF